MQLVNAAQILNITFGSALFGAAAFLLFASIIVFLTSMYVSL